MNRTLARVLGRPVPLRSEQEVTEALRPVVAYLLDRPEIDGWCMPLPDGSGVVHLSIGHLEPLRPERSLFREGTR